MEVLRYIDDVPKVLTNMKNIMKTDSVFVFTVTNFWSFSFFPVKYYIRKLLNKVNSRNELLQYFVTESGIKKQINEAGLKVESFKKLNLLSFNPLVKKVVKTGVQAEKVMMLDRILLKIPLVNNLFDTFIFRVKLDRQMHTVV